MTTLAAYMKDRKWTDQQLADRIRRDRTHVSRIRRGIVVPSLDIAVQIERITEGKVPAASFIPEPAE